MKPKYFRRLAFQSFRNKFLGEYFNTSIIINAFFASLFLSAFLFLEHFNLGFWPLHVGAALLGIGLLLTQDKRGLFWSGFFVGIFWFYWISFSFIHYGFAYLLPVGILGIGLVYGLLFWVCGLFHHSPWVKGVLVFGLSFVAPFGFNWFDLRLLLLQTPFGASFLALGLFMAGTLCLFTCKGKWRLVALVPFVVALEGARPEPHLLDTPPRLVQTNIPQSTKWQGENQDAQIEAVRDAIIDAVAEDKAVIVFPESVFPLYLNHRPKLLEELKTFSHGIEIVAGALSATEEGIYNSAYHFKAGEAHVSHKVILVPFGEAVPLPPFLKNLINAFFYDGASDFLVADEPNDFLILGSRVRSAICFEATRPELYQNSPGIMIALSNNAWFTPSIEPTLQRLLLKLYATQFHTTIYHSANGSPSEVILPKQSGPLAPVLSWTKERFELLFNI